MFLNKYVQIIYLHQYLHLFFLTMKCHQKTLGDNEEALIGLEDHWKRRLNGALDVFRSEPYFLEVVPCAIDKANSLGALLEELDVKREEVIAIGDGVCDVTMIQLAGLGVAMGHSQDSVKICADYVTASNEEDGVAEALEHFYYKFT